MLPKYPDRIVSGFKTSLNHHREAKVREAAFSNSLLSCNLGLGFRAYVWLRVPQHGVPRDM